MVPSRPQPRLIGSDPINKGLVAFWSTISSSGGIIRDISPRRRIGTFVNPSLTSWVPSPVGKTLTFNGSTNYVDTNGHAISNLPYGSFATRIRPNSGGGMVYYEAGPGYNNFAFSNPTVGSSALEFNIGSNTARNSTSRTWEASVWYDIVCTWGNDIRIYINGVLDTTIAVSGGTNSVSNDNDQIGRYSYNGGISGAYSNCSVNYIRVFNRAILPEEVARLSRSPLAGVATNKLPKFRYLGPLVPPTPIGTSGGNGSAIWIM